MSHIFFKTTALTALALTVTACQTTAAPVVTATPQQQLYSSISPSLYDGTRTLETRSAEDPTCLQYYSNATQYITTNKTGSGAAMGIVKTIGLGMLAGVAGGAVTGLGIGSGFLETAVAGTANQVVYQGGQKALDTTSDPQAADPIVTANELGEAIGCPPITKATMKASKKAAKAFKKEQAKELKNASDGQ